MPVDARKEVEALTAFTGRAPGTDAERRAAGHLRGRLEELGREAELEVVDTWPRWPAAWALVLLLGVIASVAAVSSPVAGAIIALAAALLTFADATGLPPLVRRALGRRASQNVLSRETGDKPGTLVLVAHYDAGRGGAPYAPAIERWRARLGGRLRRPIGRLEPFFWSLVLVLVCCIVRVPGIEGTWLTVVQFIPTIVLIIGLPLLVDVALAKPSPGANDNASGVAVALRLAEQLGGTLEYFDLWVLFTGAEESLGDGMRAFRRRHRKALDRQSTVLLNIDEVGVGGVRYTRSEGLLVPTRSHQQLLKLCDEIAEDDSDGTFDAHAIANPTVSDAALARGAGFPAVTITCRNALEYVPGHHLETDVRVESGALERAEGFCRELIERLDAELGPELSSPSR